MINEEAVVGIAAVNLYFLRLMLPCVRVAERMAKDDKLYHAALEGFAGRFYALVEQDPEGLSGGSRQLLDEMRARYDKADKDQRAKELASKQYE
jgi:hypothetical protein